VETLAELPFIGDQVGLFRAQPGRPKRTCNSRGAGTESHSTLMLMVRPSGFPTVAQLGRPISGKRMAAFHRSRHFRLFNPAGAQSPVGVDQSAFAPS
jgi:hypothetical protein